MSPQDLPMDKVMTVPQLSHLFRRFVIQKFSLPTLNCLVELGP